MPTINIYLNDKELYALMIKADEESQAVAPFIRQLIKEWLQKKGYEVD